MPVQQEPEDHFFLEEALQSLLDSWKNDDSTLYDVLSDAYTYSKDANVTIRKWVQEEINAARKRWNQSMTP